MQSRFFAMVVSVTAMTAFAAEDTAQVEPVRPSIGGGLQGQPLYLDVSRLAHLPASVARTEGLSANLAPAPPLNYLQVYAVGSSNIGWEILSDAYAWSTSYDHGGQFMYVAVLELGYGGNPFVRMNGGQLPSSANYANDSVCIDAYGQLYTPCAVGQTVAGWLRYFDVSGNQGGQFDYQNTSLNSPWNTMYDSLSIR
jgi:Domain of unknown function (DUF4879)